jgi:hypothetical protein
MKKVDIRTFKGREYDLNLYNKEAYQVATIIFDEIEETYQTLQDLHFEATWVLSNPNQLDKYYTERDKLWLNLRFLESQLIELDEDVNSYKWNSEKFFYKSIQAFWNFADSVGLFLAQYNIIL